MRAAFVLFVAGGVALATPAFAQSSNPPVTDNLATKADAQAAANAAQAASDAAAQARAAIPPVCAVAPTGDTLNGTVGNGSPCVPPANNTRPTAVQSGNTALAANCTFSITFARTFTSAVPFIYAAVVEPGSGQMPCKIQTRSATGATGICNAAQNTVLTLSVVTSGLTLLPFGTTCAAGTPVMFVGREPTQ